MGIALTIQCLKTKLRCHWDTWVVIVMGAKFKICMVEVLRRVCNVRSAPDSLPTPHSPGLSPS